ncbi:NADH dehydrogenase [Vespertiliibacter pulmonis]|uniref:NADH dehydrogenase n=1 Tax=Vespertiliibacter pulmonis TaxID=1443036 RepID=A0A3N4W387_9PAST|nr:NAD(P)/FAD-dependent oxidoreductase [Vespertiliibacter pulmonis]QLB21238.1 NADH dehydrogenase [Vespertiliibacter pulmonis]RPE85641.1 NADH dehydrogenase [Vespertiliibacter pulmonis]
MDNIVIVGGGAGGLELATFLGNKLGRRGKAKIILVDRNPSHLWKPLLHEVATGSLDDGTDALSYRAHAALHNFEFQQGSITGLNRSQKTITLAPIYNDNNELLVAERHISYDKLVVAIGSKSNDFGISGVASHCIFLDSAEQAKHFHQRMMELFLKFSNNNEKEVHIAIVGGGATGVELSAELYNAVKHLNEYGFGKLNNTSLKVTLIEAGNRILPALSERVSTAAIQELRSLGVDVRTNTTIVEAKEGTLITKEGETISANLLVWAAGIRVSDITEQFDGLETNRLHQLVIKDTLQTTQDDNIFVIGDCAALLQKNGKFVPPRAQAAHQMASCCGYNLIALHNNKPLKHFVFNDKGSLVSFSRFGTVGSLMGNLTKGSMFIEGRIARLAYLSLYRMHQAALHGCFKTTLIVLVGKINRFLRPSLKLH